MVLWLELVRHSSPYPPEAASYVAVICPNHHHRSAEDHEVHYHQGVDEDQRYCDTARQLHNFHTKSWDNVWGNVLRISVRIEEIRPTSFAFTLAVSPCPPKPGSAALVLPQPTATLGQ